MTKKEYQKRLSEISREYYKRRRELALEYISSENLINVGDKVTDGRTTILVTEVAVSTTMALYPTPFYIGDELDKEGKPKGRQAYVFEVKNKL